jgi:hypothetical protein
MSNENYFDPLLLLLMAIDHENTPEAKAKREEHYKALEEERQEKKRLAKIAYDKEAEPFRLERARKKAEAWEKRQPKKKEIK